MHIRVEIDGTRQAHIIPHELGDEDTADRKSVYLYPGEISIKTEDLPEGLITDKTREVNKRYSLSFPLSKTAGRMLFHIP